MSTLRVTNVQDTAGANSLTTAQIYNGASKAWVNFNGQGTVAIRANFNVSSITDNGTGDYTVNFTTAMADTNFCVTGVPTGNADGNTIGMSWTLTVINSDFTKTTTSVRVRASRNTNNDIRDAYGCNVAIFR
jgi:hypothetical protein